MLKRFFSFFLIVVFFAVNIAAIFAGSDLPVNNLNLLQVQQGNGGYIATDTQHKTYFSKNPYNLMPQDQVADGIFKTVLGQNIFVGLGQKEIFYSDGGSKWYPVPNDIAKRRINDMLFDGQTFVGVGKDAVIYSTDGFTWKEVSIFGFDFSSIAKSNDGYILYGKSSSGEYVIVPLTGDGSFRMTTVQKSPLQENIAIMKIFDGNLFVLSNSASVFFISLNANSGQSLTEVLPQYKGTLKNMIIHKDSNGKENLIIFSKNQELLSSFNGKEFVSFDFSAITGVSLTPAGTFEDLDSTYIFSSIFWSLGTSHYIVTKDFENWFMGNPVEIVDATSAKWLAPYALGQGQGTPIYPIKGSAENKLKFNDMNSVYNSVYGSVYKSVYQPTISSTPTVTDSVYTPTSDKKDDSVTSSVYQEDETNVPTKTVRLFINSAKMNVGGAVKNIDSDETVKPLIINGRTMVPIRAIVEEFDGVVGWFPQSKNILIQTGKKVIKLTLDDNIAYVDGAKVYLDVPPQILSGRTIVPLRFVMESLKLKVDWNDKDKVVTITN